jgi:hypothetical protein
MRNAQCFGLRPETDRADGMRRFTALAVSLAFPGCAAARRTAAVYRDLIIMGEVNYDPGWPEERTINRTIALGGFKPPPWT